MSDPLKKTVRCCYIEAIMPGIDVKLFHSRCKAKRFMRRIGLSTDGVEALAGTAKMVTCYQMDPQTERDHIFVVAIGDISELSYEHVMALLAHEATHISQEYFRRIGEDQPAEEEQAYVIHSICQCLFTEHRRWVNKRMKKRKRKKSKHAG